MYICARLCKYIYNIINIYVYIKYQYVELHGLTLGCIRNLLLGTLASDLHRAGWDPPESSVPWTVSLGCLRKTRGIGQLLHKYTYMYKYITYTYMFRLNIPNHRNNYLRSAEFRWNQPMSGILIFAAGQLSCSSASSCAISYNKSFVVFSPASLNARVMIPIFWDLLCPWPCLSGAIPTACPFNHLPGWKEMMQLPSGKKNINQGAIICQYKEIVPSSF